MKRNLLAAVLLIWTLVSGVDAREQVGITRHAEKQKLILTGSVKRIRREVPDADAKLASGTLYVELSLTLRNEGDVPIILLQDTPTFRDVSVAWDESFDYILAKPTGFRSSHGMKEEVWMKLKSDLNKPSPPDALSFILQPRSEIKFEETARIDLPPQRENQMNFPGPNPRVQEAKPYSRLWLKVETDTWTTDAIIIKGKVNLTEKADLIKDLQGKWKAFGFLMTGEIASQPILLQLDS